MAASASASHHALGGTHEAAEATRAALSASASVSALSGPASMSTATGMMCGAGRKSAACSTIALAVSSTVVVRFGFTAVRISVRADAILAKTRDHRLIRTSPVGDPVHHFFLDTGTSVVPVWVEHGREALHTIAGAGGLTSA